MMVIRLKTTFCVFVYVFVYTHLCVSVCVRRGEALSGLYSIKKVGDFIASSYCWGMWSGVWQDRVWFDCGLVWSILGNNNSIGVCECGCVSVSVCMGCLWIEKHCTSLVCVSVFMCECVYVLFMNWKALHMFYFPNIMWIYIWGSSVFISFGDKHLIYSSKHLTLS